MEFGISFGFDEMPADPGDVCETCNQLIIGMKFVAYAQAGEAENSEYIHQVCRFCYVEHFEYKPDYEFMERKKKAVAEVEKMKCAVHGHPPLFYTPESESRRLGWVPCCEPFRILVEKKFYEILGED